MDEIKELSAKIQLGMDQISTSEQLIPKHDSKSKYWIIMNEETRQALSKYHFDISKGASGINTECIETKYSIGIVIIDNKILGKELHLKRMNCINLQPPTMKETIDLHKTFNW